MDCLGPVKVDAESSKVIAEKQLAVELPFRVANPIRLFIHSLDLFSSEPLSVFDFVI